ncbi:MAG: efflux transporter outer membrane subunit [Janthinobacterium lividum]
MRRRGFLLGTAALTGCSLGPDYQRPQLDLPPAFRATSDSAAAAWPEPGWWRGFGSPELDRLIDRARGFNTDLAAAVARVIQADAQARISGAPLLPSLSGTGNFNYQRTGTGLSRSRNVAVTTAQVGDLTTGNVTTSSGSGHYFDSRSYSVGLNVSYDLDFWGRNRATYQSSQAAALSSRFDQETVALTVIASVANTYFQVLAGQDRLRVAQRNLRDAERILGAYRARLTVGTANALDVSQQEALVAGQRANLPNFQNTIEQQRIALGILVGTPPERLDIAGGSLETLNLPPVSPGLPAELLQRRPDVASAEALLIAANANIRAARAAFFPDVTLTAQGGLSSAFLSTLTGPGTLVAQLAAALTQPIFDNGLRQGQLDVAKGRAQELVADYARAILQSFTDVEQALAAIRYAREQEELERQAITVAQRSADIAAAQLQAGTIDIITSLNTQQTLFTDLDLLTQIRLARFQGLVNLYKALGGGWRQDDMRQDDTGQVFSR